VNRSVIITAGVVLILVMVGVWLYLFLFNTGDTGGEGVVDPGFDLNPRPANVIEENLVTEPEYTVDTETERLSQLTTKPVAGFVGFGVGTSSRIRYVEQGTGHIYEISTGGEERMISRTTIPRVQEAHFSPDGETVVLVAFNDFNRDVFASPVDPESEALSITDLPVNAQNIDVQNGGSVRYTFQTNEGSVGYESTLGTDVRELFRVPFRSITALWGKENTWVYNRPAEGLPGYLYEIVGGTYETTSYTGYTLVADYLNGFLGVTSVRDGNPESYFISVSSGDRFDGFITLIPEKCDSFNETSAVVCAAGLVEDFSITDWYKGLTQSSDFLWTVDVLETEATLLENLEQTAGRSLDISTLLITENDNLILFTNKTDGTLWSYEL